MPAKYEDITERKFTNDHISKKPRKREQVLDALAVYHRRGIKKSTTLGLGNHPDIINTFIEEIKKPRVQKNFRKNRKVDGRNAEHANIDYPGRRVIEVKKNIADPTNPKIKIYLKPESVKVAPRIKEKDPIGNIKVGHYVEKKLKHGSKKVQKFTLNELRARKPHYGL